MWQVISSKKKAAGVRVRTASLGMHGIPEEATEDREGLVGMGGGAGRVEERAELAGEIGAMVTGLTEFRAELLQLHAIVSCNMDSDELEV